MRDLANHIGYDAEILLAYMQQDPMKENPIVQNLINKIYMHTFIA